MLQARHCKTCRLNWPMDGYKRCAVCLGELTVNNGIRPMTSDAARRRAAFAAFDRYLASETPAQRRARRARWRQELERLESLYALPSPE